MIDFPASPNIGDTFTSGGLSWKWDGAKWAATGGAGTYLPLAGGTMTGAMALAADPAAALQPATKQYVDAGGLGGFINKFYNPDFTIWQRSSPVVIPANSSGYTANGYVVQANGAACSVSVGGKLSAAAYSRSSLTLTAASGLTTLTIQQRIESYVATALGGRTCTFQCRLLNNMASPVTPTLQCYTMNSQDVASPNTLDAQAALQTVAPGASAVLSYTFPVAVVAYNGYIVLLNFAAQLNAASGNVIMTDWDIRITPGLPTGLNANPPPPEQRLPAIEFTNCLRYYQPFGGLLIWGGNVTTGVTYYTYSGFTVPMRAAPTLTITDGGNNGFAAGLASAQGIGARGFQCYKTANATVNGGYYVVGYTANAEI